MSEIYTEEDIAKHIKWARANGPTSMTDIPDIMDQLRAERDEARAAIERVRAALTMHSPEALPYVLGSLLPPPSTEC